MARLPRKSRQRLRRRHRCKILPPPAEGIRQLKLLHFPVEQLFCHLRTAAYNRLMHRLTLLATFYLCLVVPGFGQSPPGERDPKQNPPPPRSERDKEAGESSSRDTRIDLS